jgi:hypothetical protein
VRLILKKTSILPFGRRLMVIGAALQIEWIRSQCEGKGNLSQQCVFNRDSVYFAFVWLLKTLHAEFVTTIGRVAHFGDHFIN